MAKISRRWVSKSLEHHTNSNGTENARLASSDSFITIFSLKPFFNPGAPKVGLGYNDAYEIKWRLEHCDKERAIEYIIERYIKATFMEDIYGEEVMANNKLTSYLADDPDDEDL